ncbi:MAG: C10 family peptidase [Paludibacteraceae bacterium]|nr:C10 family peptidase [Paludibacteraceae bacterium]
MNYLYFFRKTTVLLLCLTLTTTVFANRISQTAAAKVANNFMNQFSSTIGQSAPNRKMTLNEYATNADNQFYVYEYANGEGWVIVAGSDLAYPVLAYSLSGRYEADNQPVNVKSWLKGYNQAIMTAEASGKSAAADVKDQWKALIAGVSPAPAEIVVSPLLKTAFDQDAPYNNLCPYDYDKGERTVTGCVATAMAQILAYWKYPSQGAGYHSYTHSSYGRLSANFASTKYDWSNIRNDYNNNSGTTAQKEAVSTLIYHCGVGTEMDYNVADEGGSGTFIIEDYCNTGTDNAEYAFKNYFDYHVDESGIRDNTISKSRWLTLLKNDLDNGRPVLYAGFGSGGHCFVCDGYDSNNYFHFNWGWSGNLNGYFRLDALEPGGGGIGAGGHVYNERQMAIFGLRPNKTQQEIEEEESENNSIGLRLYSKITAPDSVRFYKDFTCSVKIANLNETKDIECTICAALFDENLAFYDYVDSIQGTRRAQRYFNFEATYTGRAAFTPGKYYLAYFYRTNDKGWTLIEGDDYKSVIPFKVYYTDGIEMYSDFEIESGEFRQGEEVEIKLAIANVKGKDFKGAFRLNLSRMEDGKWLQNIEIKEDKEIKNGYYVTYYFKGRVTVDPGTYNLQAAYQNDGETSWYFIGSKYYINPQQVVVKASEVPTDRYENNNQESKAYQLYPAFDINGNCVFDLNDATLHIGTDEDYYSVSLPADNDLYTVTAQVFDATINKGYTIRTINYYYSSSDGVLYSFDSNARSFTAQGGTTVYFYVSPLLSGGTGSYGLRVKVQRGIAKSDAISVRYIAPDDWEAVYFWAWTADGDIFARWPGITLQKDMGGYYSYTFDEGLKDINVIFNNGNGVQTMDLPEPLNESVCMTFDGADKPAKIIDCLEPITIKYKDPENWSKVYLWAWTAEGDIFAKWPGMLLLKGDDGYYSYTFDAGLKGINVIFSNGEGTQTIDLAEPVNESVCMTFDGANLPARIISCEDSGGTTDISTNDDTGNIYIINGIAHSRGDICLYTVTGKLVRSAKNEMVLTDLPYGIYIIQSNKQTVKYIR